MNKLLRKELLIGLIVLVALAILFFGVNYLKGINMFKAANYYTAVYTNVEGLAISAPVTVNGYKIGQVREIEYQYDNPGHVMVEIALDKSLKVPADTKAVLTTDLLGTASIVLEMAKNQDFLEVGSELVAENASGLMESVNGKLMPSVESVLPKIDTLLTNINKIVSDQAVMASVKRLDAITANLEKTTARLATAMASIQPITADVKTITGNVASISGDFAQLSSQLKELPIDSLTADLAVVTANLRQLSERLNNSDSTVGKLTNDPALYDNLNETVKALDALLKDIKENPKRYISIKLL